MNAVQIVIFALCIYQISAGAYEDALTTCRTKYGFKDDKAVDYFFANAAWSPEIKGTLDCYFNCLGDTLKIVDASGVPNKDKLTEAAKQYKDVQELQLLASPDIITTCTPQATGATACAATQNYASCAVKNAPKP